MSRDIVYSSFGCRTRPIRFIRLLRLLHPLFKNGERMILTQRMFFHNVRVFAIHNCEADNIERENNREISLTKYTEKKHTFPRDCLEIKVLIDFVKLSRSLYIGTRAVMGYKNCFPIIYVL